MTSLGEGSFDFFDISHNTFGVRAITSREIVLVPYTPVGDGAVAEQLMMLPANVIFFGWYPILFSMLL